MNVTVVVEREVKRGSRHAFGLQERLRERTENEGWITPGAS
jgi:hypothetical protein